MKPMKTKRAFALLSCLLFLVAGCDKSQRAATQTNETAAKQINENNFNDPFKTQLMQLLSSASQVNAATEAGVSKQDLLRFCIVAKGQFDLLENFWPNDFCPEGKKDMQEAFKGWSCAIGDLAVGNASTNSGRAYLMYVTLSQYETNPFRVRFRHYREESPDEDLICLSDYRGGECNNMPQLLSIASHYFERGRQSIVTEIKKRSNAP
jgi:hypothetical protein